MNDLGALTAEALDFIETTSVDGRIYVSTEDLLSLVHTSQQILAETFMLAMIEITDAEHLHVVTERADGMASSLAMFDSVLHACEDKEGLESLSPGDFL